ncbi:MAG: branched-chain amino acid ABC transporter permease, partial [Roseiflexaceae bacterium]|nr:branched-chain amino acid ABC transporter permease [Roseiflexaceae bacterium]
YVAAIISTQPSLATDGRYPLPLVLLEMLVAGLLSGVLAVLVGVPALRLRGIYLALATIAFVEISRVLSLNLTITGGAVGIFGIPQPFGSSFEYMWLALPMLLISMFIAYRLERIRAGRAFRALREDELAADAMGINPTANKVTAFTIGAILAGVVGAVSAHFLNTWNARQGTFDAAIIYLAFVLIGGSRTFVGPVVGGMVLTALPELLRALAGVAGLPPWFAKLLLDGRLIIFGLLIALGSLFFPQGIITPELFRRKPAPAAKQPDAPNVRPSEQ